MGRKQTQVIELKPEMEPLPRLCFDLEEAAEVLRIGRNSLLGLIQEGRLGVVRVGARVLVPRMAVEKFLAGVDLT